MPVKGEKMKNHCKRKTFTGRECLLIILWMFSQLPCLNANPVISTNIGDFIFKYNTSEENYNIKVYYYCPKRFSPKSKIVFVLHGDNRNGAFYRNEWSTYAEKYNFLVLCPELTKEDFPYMKYNLGNIYDEKKKKFNPKEEWTFNIIEKLFDFVREDKKTQATSYSIFGHSSGGQFVQRMVLFMPDARFSTAIANGSGWYTMPNFTKKFEYGLRLTPLTDDTLKKAFGKELVILMGEKDFVSKVKPKSYEETTHSFDRLWRAIFFYDEAKSKAKELGVELKWIFKTVPNADHNNPKHAQFAIRYIMKPENKNADDPNEIDKNPENSSD